jgi:hypothetical protein
VFRRGAPAVSRGDVSNLITRFLRAVGEPASHPVAGAALPELGGRSSASEDAGSIRYPGTQLAQPPLAQRLLLAAGKVMNQRSCEAV